MIANPRRGGLCAAALVWLVTGLAVAAPVWWFLGVHGVLLGWLGPLGILAFKPHENVLAKLALAALFATPTIAGVAWAAARWTPMTRIRRALSLIALSVAWHAPGTVAWIGILSGLN